MQNITRNIRSGQLITPFGIGHIVNFPGEQSLMIGGLNLWEKYLDRRREEGAKIDLHEFTIQERRLKKLLKVGRFFQPFPYKTRGESNTKLAIPAVRFPGWYYCPNVKCGSMRKISLTQREDPTCTMCARGDRKYKMIPVRFIAVCSKGHVQDVPFMEWVHDGPVTEDKQKHFLSYHAGTGSGDLSSIRIHCSCGKYKSLAGIMNVSRTSDGIIYNSALASIGLTEEQKSEIKETNPNNNNPLGQYCRGSKPWLGTTDSNEPCREHLQVLIRGGSNVHFANIVSAIYLPQPNEDQEETVDRIADKLGLEKIKELYEQTEDHSVLKIVLETQEEIRDKKIELNEALKIIEKRLKDQSDNSEDKNSAVFDDLRFPEYEFFQHEYSDEKSVLKTKIIPLDQYDDADFMNEFFEKVVLLDKLKETRVFAGFSRIIPRFVMNKNDLSTERVKWLPAIQVSGEGILLIFRKEKIKNWLTQFSKNGYPLVRRYKNRVNLFTLRDKDTIDPAFVMIHTFAHLLIKRLVFNSGYSASSLKERIYYDPRKDMRGVLIYTASGDSEGSMGGLVKQGKEKYLPKLIKEAIADAEWCSADPVCMEIGISSGQGPDNVNGAACHNCCLLPETSCEEFNTLLDRALIVGTQEKILIGFFNN